MSKGLEALERIKLVYDSTDIPIIEKELKALEIIKRFNTVLDLHNTLKLFISKEEYELLKEVLL